MAQSMKFVPKARISSAPALVQITVWRWQDIVWTTDGKFTDASVSLRYKATDNYSRLMTSMCHTALFKRPLFEWFFTNYNDIIMCTMAYQITSLAIVYSTVYSGANQRKHQSSASLAFVQGIHRWPVNFPHKGPVPWKMFPFDDVIIWRLRSFQKKICDK